MKSTTARDEAIIQALLEYPTVKEAAAAVKLSTFSIYAKLKEPAFAEELERRKTSLLDAACATLQGTLGAALRAVREIIENTDNAAQIRLNASQIVLQNALRYSELTDLKRRIEQIEKTLEAKT